MAWAPSGRSWVAELMRSCKHDCRDAHPAIAPLRIRARCTASMPLPGRVPRPFSVTLDGPLSVLRGKFLPCQALDARLSTLDFPFSNLCWSLAVSLVVNSFPAPLAPLPSSLVPTFPLYTACFLLHEALVARHPVGHFL